MSDYERVKHWRDYMSVARNMLSLLVQWQPLKYKVIDTALWITDSLLLFLVMIKI